MENLANFIQIVSNEDIENGNANKFGTDLMIEFALQQTMKNVISIRHDLVASRRVAIAS